MPSRIDAVVLVSRLDLPTLQALAYAKATRPDTLTALTVATGEAEIQQLESEWAGARHSDSADCRRRAVPGYHRPVLRYVVQLRSANPRTLVVVYIPEYVVGRPWEQLLHNQSALRLKARLLFSGACWSPACPGSSGPARSGSSTSAQQQTEALGQEVVSSGTGS